MAGPLEGIKVLDLTRFLAGAYCTMVLGDLGAEIIKVEHPQGGDPSRNVGPYYDGDVSSYFLSVNRGKRSVMLDLKTEKAKNAVFRLAARSDIVVENFVPGAMERFGLGYETLREKNPGIIYAACSGFGRTGPYARRTAFDMLIQGMAGTVSITGEPDRPPVRAGFSIGDIGASMFLTVGILAALREREQSGEGQLVEVGMLDCQVALLENAFARYFCSGEVPQPEGGRHPVATPVQIVPTADGYMILAIANDTQWETFCGDVGRPEWAEDERFKTNPRRVANREILEGMLFDLTRSRTTSEWTEAMEKIKIPCGPVNRIDQAADDPQVRSREMVVEVEHPRRGALKVINNPIRFSRSTVGPQGGAADLGEHTEEILRDLVGLSSEEIEAWREGEIV